MKRTAIALTLITALLFSTIVTIQVATIAEANPIGMLPTEPEPLVVTFLSPKNASRCLRDSMSITFTLKNPTLGGADSLTYMIDGQTKGNINGVITAKEGERFVGFFDLLTYSATIDLLGLSDGWHTLTVWASGTSPYDPEKGLNRIDATVYGSDSIQFLFDVVALKVSVLLPQNQTYTTTNVPLNFTLSEKADWVGYSLDGQPPITINENATLADLPEGLHSLTVYANDTVGRRGNSETVYFSIVQETQEGPVVGQSEPFPTILVVAASGTAVAVAGAGLLVYFRKRRR